MAARSSVVDRLARRLAGGEPEISSSARVETAFDGVARALAAPVTRRRAVMLVGGAIAGGSLLRPGAARAQGGCWPGGPKVCEQNGRRVCVEENLACCSNDECAIACAYPWRDCESPANCADTERMCRPPHAEKDLKFCSQRVSVTNGCVPEGSTNSIRGWCCEPHEECGAEWGTCECPEEIKDLEDCPDRVQRSQPNVNGCGGEGVPAAITSFLNRFKDADFTPACNAHDVCYGTCGETQERCDKLILRDLQAICRATYGTDDFEHRGVCLSQTRQYYRAVSTTGRRFYEKAQRDFCRCCPDPAQDESERPLPPPSPRPDAPDIIGAKDQEVSVPVNCAGPAPCEGSLALSAVVGSGGARGSGSEAAQVRRTRKVLLGKRAFDIAPGKTARVKVPLSRKGRRLLRKRKRLTVLATTRTRVGNGRRVDTGLDSFVLTARRGRRRR